MKESAFGLLIPEDTDVPDGPNQIGDNAERLDALLYRAGAQGKKFEQAVLGTRENTAYGGLTNGPDEVADLVIAKGDLLFVQYEALWSHSGVDRAAIFLDPGSGAVQLKAYASDGPAAVQNAIHPGGTEPGAFHPLASSPVGLVGGEGSGFKTIDVPTTGLALSQIEAQQHFEIGGVERIIAAGVEGLTGAPGLAYGVCVIRGLAAGTYDVSVRFKASSGKTEVKNRVLRAWTKSFA